MNEQQLLDKLRRIEALYSGATTPGERTAAGAARDRMLSRLAELVREDPPVEYKFTMVDMWSRRLFVALLRRYDLRPYRYKRQRYTTVMVRVPKKFVDETLWPEFDELDDVLQEYLEAVTNRVITEALQSDGSEAEVVAEAPALPATASTSLKTSPGDSGPPRSASTSSGTARTGPPASGSKKVGRNSPCPCGSGKKSKRCCGGR